MPQKRREGVWYGKPVKHGRGWRVLRRGGPDDPPHGTWLPFETEGQALAAKRAAAQRQDTTGRKVGDCITAYVRYLSEDVQSKRLTVKNVTNFLAAFFPDPKELIGDIGPGHYDAVRKRPGRQPGSTWSAASHRRALGVATAFCQWMVKRGWLRKNPLAEVEPIGRAKAGKAQLTADEAARWLDVALPLAETEPGALGAAMCLLLAFRSHEVLSRQVRHLDAGGKAIWVEGKTHEPPTRILLEGDLAVLQPLLRRAAASKTPLAQLVDTTTFGLTYWTRKICALANVPKVCVHALRGMHSTFARQAGASGDAVLKTLRHSARVDEVHYAAPGAVREGQRATFLRVLKGG